MTLIANTGGAIVSALIGALTWLLFAFAGTPIRKFWDLRGEVAQAMNQYARNISEPHGNESLLFAQTVAIVQSRANSAKEFRQLGLQLISFWQNEALARFFSSYDRNEWRSCWSIVD